MTHYDSKGRKVGESRPGMFGSTNHYDAKGNKVQDISFAKYFWGFVLSERKKL